MNDNKFYSLPVEAVANPLKTDPQLGLSESEAHSRLKEHGFNELVERPQTGWPALLFRQFNNFLIITLLAAAVISLLLGEVIDASAIIIIVALNGILGVVQESKAEQALAALKKMAVPNAVVIRQGRTLTVPARDLVPGDLVLLEAGNYVPADVRLVATVNLKIDEAALTGESTAVVKETDPFPGTDLPLGEQRNCAFMGTLVTYGRGQGLVTATGMRTQIGLIAELLQSYEEEQTPIQQKLNQLGQWLAIASLVVCAFIFIFGLLRDTRLTDIASLGLGSYLLTYQASLIELFMIAVSLAVAAVPEGLPAVVTICLALGMQQMVRRHALIRKLPAVETLGCATIICSDKTGTLTQNEMTVLQGWAGGKLFHVTGQGYQPCGDFIYNERSFMPRQEPLVRLLLIGGLLCSDARLEQSRAPEGSGSWHIIGDPTEGALVVAAAKAGLCREELERVLPRLREIPFDSERKRMTTLHRVIPANGSLPNLLPSRGSLVAFVKGAPDVVLDYCTGAIDAGGIQPLTSTLRQEILTANQRMARQALRVLSVAYRPVAQLPAKPEPAQLESDLIFVGLLGMIDPARPEVKTAVQVAKDAGLKSVMITGDYKETAIAIAREIGLLSPGGRVVTGAELEQWSDEELTAVVEEVDAYVRVSPQHKVKIVEAFKAREHIVAMTGDGVNDAPALKRANIGIAMGITGTDVSKETADMILTDDNFASIVSAVEVGRVIYANIRKFVFYLVACNAGEILIIFSAILSGLPIPLRPIQLLWLNLVTDGAPALALAMEKGEPDTMKRKPRPPREPVINRPMLISIAVIAVADTLAVLGAFGLVLAAAPGQLDRARTVAFATLVCSELLRAYTSRSEYYSVFSLGLFSNPWLVKATALSLALLVLVIYLPGLQPFFNTTALSLNDWLVLSPFVLISPAAAEVTKALLRGKAPGPRS